MFKFTLTITTSVFLLMSGTVDVFAMDDDNMPRDVMPVILKEASKDNNPRHLTSVCKSFYNIIRENQDIQGEELHYSAMNPFMKECMHTYWESRFCKGVLEYEPPIYGKKIKLPFLDLKDKDGTFDLSTCEDAGKYLVITINSGRFFEIEGKNKLKDVIWIVPYHWIEEVIRSKPDHPSASFMEGWDPDIAPVSIFWRWGTDEQLNRVDAQTKSTMKKISSKNLYINWLDATAHGKHTSRVRGSVTEAWFHVNF